jgi:hypothetical protein
VKWWWGGQWPTNMLILCSAECAAVL